MKRSTLAFCLLLPLAIPGCPAFRSALRAAAEALPWLVDLVSDILGREDYQAQLDTVAAEQGADAVAAAVRTSLARLSKPAPAPQSRAAVVTMPPPARDPLRADRAELWLRRRGLKP